MTFLNFAERLGVGKFLILCLTSAFVVVAVIFLIIRIVKELTVKVGGVSISLKGDKQKQDIIGLVFEYGRFQDQMNDTRDLAVDCLHSQAKRHTKLQINQYLQKLHSEYTKAIEPEMSETKQITVAIFNLFTNEMKGLMLGYCMEIYEKNHLAQKTDEELRTLAHDHYEKLADLFKDQAATIWSSALLPYSQIRDISKSIAPFVEGLVFSILIYYKGLSQTRVKVYDLAREISDGVKKSVGLDLKLPSKAMYIAENFYTESNGLDVALIKEFLGEQVK